MSPPPPESDGAAPPPPPSGKAGKRTARLVGSSLAGVIELFGFHPVDTVAKRLMNEPGQIRVPGAPMSVSVDAYSRVIFRDAHASSSALVKYTSLFPGLSFAAGYKIAQRVYKFGGQPVVTEALTRRYQGAVGSVVGDSRAKPLLHASAGALIGVGEIVLLPLDVLKIKSQNNPGALRGRGLVSILRQESLRGLYRGAGWTAARNAPGSFSLFGASALVKERVFGLERYNDATFGQNFVASLAGGVASITVASPLDVIKTRLQTRDFSSTVTGGQLLRDLIRHEGPSAFFKGLVPKLLVVGPKLVFSFTIAQHTIATLERWFEASSDSA